VLELIKNPDPLFLVCAWFTITTVVSSVGYYWHKVQKAELEASLKHEMIQRGMSADEIERVIQASSRSGARANRSDTATEKETADY
jgi:hypothetical protein